MKKKKLIIIGIVVGLAAACLLFFGIRMKQPVSLSDACWKYTKDVNANALEDGTYSVTLKAPDMKQIMKDEIDQNGQVPTTEKDLVKLIRSNKDRLKEYSFTVESKETEVVQAGYMDEIGKEISMLIMELYMEDTNEE